jgi:hypothetical protein
MHSLALAITTCRASLTSIFPMRRAAEIDTTRPSLGSLRTHISFRAARPTRCDAIKTGYRHAYPPSNVAIIANAGGDAGLGARQLSCFRIIIQEIAFQFRTAETAAGISLNDVSQYVSR